MLYAAAHGLARCGAGYINENVWIEELECLISVWMLFFEDMISS